MRNLANASQRVLEAASDQPMRRIPRQPGPFTSEREFIAQERRKAARRTVLYRRVRRAEKQEAQA